MSALRSASRRRREFHGGGGAWRRGRSGCGLIRFVLLWFVLSLGVAAASPIVHPQAFELVCSGVGVAKVVVQTDDGVQEIGASHLDCPLCLPAGAPPPPPLALLPAVQPLAHAVQPVPAAILAAATALPPPARGPPSLR